MTTKTSNICSNRDRFYEKISPIFKESRYTLCKATEGKYKDKIIQIINNGSGTHDFHIWCHARNDRLDLVIPVFRVNQISPDIQLKERCKNIKKDDRLDGQDAVSYQEIDEEVLVDFCKYITSHII